MKKALKIMVLVLGIIVIVGMFTGCDEKNKNTTEETTTETQTAVEAENTTEQKPVIAPIVEPTAEETTVEPTTEPTTKKSDNEEPTKKKVEPTVKPTEKETEKPKPKPAPTPMERPTEKPKPQVEPTTKIVVEDGVKYSEDENGIRSIIREDFANETEDRGPECLYCGRIDCGQSIEDYYCVICQKTIKAFTCHDGSHYAASHG